MLHNYWKDLKNTYMKVRLYVGKAQDGVKYKVECKKNFPNNGILLVELYETRLGRAYMHLVH